MTSLYLVCQLVSIGGYEVGMFGSEPLSLPNPSGIGPERDDDGQEFETTAWSPNLLAEFLSFPGPYYSWNFLDTWYLQTGNDIVDEYPANGTLPARANVK
jgi:hypothetical protein